MYDVLRKQLDNYQFKSGAVWGALEMIAQTINEKRIRPTVVFTTVCLLMLAAFVGSHSWYQTRGEAATTIKPQIGDGRLPNFDIREDINQIAVEYLAAARAKIGLSPRNIAVIRNGFVRGETALRSRIPQVKIEYNAGLGIPEVIGPEAWQAKIGVLSPASGRSRAEILRNFVIENTDLLGVKVAQANRLIITADYVNPDGNLAFAHLEQRINGVPVFGGEIKAGFTADRRLIRVVNNLAAGLNYYSLPTDFGEPADAVRWAAAQIDYNLLPAELSRNTTDSTRIKAVFGSGEWTATAEKMYFPTEAGVAVTAWRVLIWQPVNAYYVIVDAKSGSMLWRKNITERQTAAATFSVYGNSTSPMMTADSPAPFTPGCGNPNNCTQPSIVARTNFTLTGNENPNEFNNLGWIPDAGLPVRTPANPNITDGNNCEAGIDRDGTQGVDPLGHAAGNPVRVFNYAYNPAPGNPPPGDDPTPPNPQTYPPTQFQQGITTHGFYLVNRWHDEMYKVGFTEAARNFQHFNFGRGGTEGDRISLEVQDSSGTNGANFSAPADGGRGRMQNFVWTGSAPGRDGTLDGTVVVHELTHGVSSRLHGNTVGLNTNIARGMGEGWSDFYALALLSEPGDAACGIYVVGGYLSYRILPNYEANHYYGIRRFPNAKIGCVGPNGLPHNPLTFDNLNAGNCSVFASAYPPGPLSSPTCDQLHNAGEIWSAALWEMRGVLIDQHGVGEGNRRSLQYITDGMKLAPLNPTYLQERDAIITAAALSDPADAAPVREGFRRRGMGYSARIQTVAPLVVVEAFDFLPMPLAAPFDFDGDGKSDISVFRPTDRVWYLNRSTAGFSAAQFGLSTDKITPADFDGDGKTDIAVFRDGVWYWLNSTTGTVGIVQFGLTNDIPVPADFTGDGRDELGVYRGGVWYTFNLANNQFQAVQFGISLDKPVPADFDGDGKTDFAIYRAGVWWWLRSSDGQSRSVQFGLASDKPVVGDYDGDGKADHAVFRDGVWYILQSQAGFTAFQWGLTTDIPAPADFDGDGKTDAAIYRDGVWWQLGSQSGVRTVQFGITGDRPIPAAFAP